MESPSMGGSNARGHMTRCIVTMVTTLSLAVWTLGVTASPASATAPSVVVNATQGAAASSGLNTATIDITVNRAISAIATCSASNGAVPIPGGCGAPTAPTKNSTSYRVLLSNLTTGTYTVTVSVKLTDKGKANGSTTFTILPPLTITASSTSMLFGSTVPAITPSYSGFVNGDTANSLTTAPTCSTTATSSSPVGAYSSSCAGAVDASYWTIYVTGTVSIGPAQSDLAVTITDGVTTAYAGSSTTYTITLTNYGPSAEPAGVGAFGNVWPGTTGAMGTAFDEAADGCVIDGAYWGCQTSVALAAGASRTYQFTASIDLSYLIDWGVTLPSTAWAGNDPNANDPNLDNDLAWDYDIVVAPCTRYIDGFGGDAKAGEVVCGGEGSDSLDFVSPGGVFYGNGGDDSVTLGVEGGTFFGGGGNDSTGANNGTFYGGDGNDNAEGVGSVFYGEAGDDSASVIGLYGFFYGGEGNDTTGPWTGAVWSNYGTFNGDAGDDTLVGDNYGTFDGGDGADAHVGINYGTLISVP